MRKRYLLLTLLLPLATMFSSGNAFAQTDDEYNAAMEAIKDGGIYFISTDCDGITYFMTNTGDLTDTKEAATIFTFKKQGDGGFKTYGFMIDGGSGYCFSNPVSSANIDDVKINTHTINGFRPTWDIQVLFLNSEGKYAVRATNAKAPNAGETSGWNYVGSTFWTAADGIAGYSVEPQYIWELETPDDEFQVYTILNNLLDKYGDQVYDDGSGYSMNRGMGEDFGQYNDFETWDKFYNLLQNAMALFEQFDPYDDYKWIGDGECLSIEEAKAMVAEADSMYDKILDSEVPYTADNGYYRIIAHNRFKSTFDESGFVDKAMAASFDKAHMDRIVYGTLNRDRANFIWKLTRSEEGDSILLQNAGMGTYISLESIRLGHLETTEDPSQAGYVMFDYAGFDYVEPDGMPDDRDIFCIRFAQEPRDGNYFHQNGHASVSDENSPWGNYGVDSGTEQDMAFWRRTYDYGSERSDYMTSEWYLEPVSDAEAEEAIENFEMIKNHDLLVAQNNALRAEVLAALETAKDLKMVESANQLSSPFSDSSEGQHIEYLVDGDKTTFWHSDYHNAAPQGMFYNYEDVELECHYVQFSEMQDMVGDCVLYWCERAGAANDRPSKVAIFGANTPDADNEEWVEIAALEIPNVAAGEESTIPFTNDVAYPYIRVLVFDTDGSGYSFRKFWHAAEIQFYITEPRPNSQFVTLGQIAQNLQDTYDRNISVADEDVTVELYEELQEVFKAFLAGLVDPTELRNAIATYANATKAVVEGTNPGEWTDTSDAQSFETLYAEVVAYDKNGRYNAAQNHKYAVMLKAMQKSIMEQANGVETDKWYNIMFPTEAMYTDFGFDPSAPGGASLIVDHPDQFGYYVVPGVRTNEMGLNDEGEEAATGKYYLEFATKETARQSMYLYFSDPDEIEDPDASMFRFIEYPADATDYKALFSDMKENMLMALDMSATYTKGDALITDVSQLSSNSLDRAEGNKLEYLIDGIATTYWHSDYHKDVLAPPYLQVAFKKPVSGLVQVDMTRRQNATNGHIVRMYVLGSNDASNWTNIGYLETPFTNQNESVSSYPFNLNGSYSYLRFILTCRYGTDAGGNTEFDPFPVISSGDEYNVLWTYCHAAEFQIYPLTADTDLNASGKTLQQAYTTANKVILKDATAEDLAAATAAYRAYRTSFNAIEGRTVLPNGTDKAAPVYVIQNKATGLFVNCKDYNNANNSLEAIPSFFDYKPLGYQRSLIHITRIDGKDCSYLHSQNFDHRFVTWNATAPNSNSGLVLRIAESFNPEELAPFSFYKDIKPGRINNWCNSVTITPEPNEDAHAYTLLGRYQNDEGDFLALKEIKTIPAGQPAFYIYADTTDYDAEDEYVEAVKFTIPANEELVVKGDTINGLIGCITDHTLLQHEIYFSGNKAVCIAQGGYYVGGNSAVLDMESCPNVSPNEEYDFSICLGGEGDKADGVDIPTAIEKISQPGNVYSTDGKLLLTGATLNSLKSLGRGMYILNGVKVVVK